MDLGYDLEAAFAHNGGQLITIDEVEAVDAAWDSGTDEPDFVWLLRLKDGRWAAATGYHDYTGWDCQSSFGMTIHATRDEAIRFGLTQNDRENLGVALPEDPAKAEG